MSDASSNAAFPVPPTESIRAALEADRVGTLQQISALTREFEGIVEANALVAIDDEHDPEGASTAFERAHVAALLSRAREHLNDLDHARERLERGDYGRCEQCGEPIPTGRLEVRPAAKTCVRCASVAR
ncbi:TraR/DksA family transcriptional regulator [Streptomyces sp. NPDC085900]|uniref:TraR/DksA family transcriptional regulator n=1 Tax=Streptomyces sp. NPDC085900 TaxID=3365737 RepID=UPI0037D2B2BF